MSAIGTGYDLSASQFSPDGRVFQVEYANKAVENSGTVVAIRGKDGVVLAVEKLVTSKLYERGANKRIFTIDRHVGIAVSGLLADAKSVVNHGASEAKKYRSQYDQPIPLKTLKDRISMYMHAYTLYSAVRPFGASLLLASWNEDDGPELYGIEPSGSVLGYFGCSIGKAKQAAKTELEKLNSKDILCKDLLKEAAKIIYSVHDEIKDKAFELELSWIGSFTGGKHEFVPKDLFDAAETYAKDALKQDSDSDEAAQ